MPTYRPAPVDDAKNRAARTFWQGLLVDVVMAAAGALTIALSAPELTWSKPYWIGVAVVVGKTVLQAVTSYVARRVKAPAV